MGLFGATLIGLFRLPTFQPQVWERGGKTENPGNSHHIAPQVPGSLDGLPSPLHLSVSLCSFYTVSYWKGFQLDCHLLAP